MDSSANNTDHAKKVPLSKGFQLVLVSGILHGEIKLAPCLDELQPDHLTVRGLPIIWQEIQKSFRETGGLPSWRLAKERIYGVIKDPGERNYYYRVLRKCRRAVSDSEVHYILRHVHNFASLQRVAVAFRDALPLFERGDLVGVRNTLGSALNGTTRDLRGGIKYFSTI